MEQTLLCVFVFWELVGEGRDGGWKAELGESMNIGTVPAVPTANP